MKIEIAKLGRMSQTGSSLMTLYQDKYTPILDLLVRESVQNCLDAGSCVDDHADKKDYVEVNFLTGDFSPAKLNAILDGSTDALNKRYPASTARFLAVQDKYTAGLTGPLRIKDVKDYQYGNLLKLVYDICKPQEGAGAGGSWGIGKTIFFRVGKGLVVYYSRIWDDELQSFSSRFAVSLVEDEHSPDAIIPRDGKYSNTGIAWWGNPVSDDETEPITDEDEIERYLSIFGIQPFKDKETGTIVIVPYIDEDWLLTNNRIEDSDDSDLFIPTWLHNIDDYISMAVQRWYFPRLNNNIYPYGCYLKAYVNGQQIKRKDMQPLFLYWQDLYNSALAGKAKVRTESDDLIDIRVESVNLKKNLAESCAGHLAYALVGRDTLGMCPPDNLYSPYINTDTDDTGGETNKPLFAFCRMPGMVVNYKGNEPWLKSVPYSEKDKYLIAFFALNSENDLADGSQSLEEYVRKSELADHHSWDDYNTGNGKKPDIITKIKWHVSNKLSKAFAPDTDEEEKKIDTGWGKVMADLMLPKEGFGTRSSRPTDKRTGLEYENHKTISLALSEDDTEYYGDTMEFTYYIKSREKTQSFNLYLNIGTENKPISLEDWENDGLDIPFAIDSILLRIDKLDGKEYMKVWRINSEDSNLVDELLTVKNLKNKDGVVYGAQIRFSEPHTFVMDAMFSMKIISRVVKPVLKAE